MGDIKPENHPESLVQWQSIGASALSDRGVQDALRHLAEVREAAAPRRPSGPDSLDREEEISLAEQAVARELAARLAAELMAEIADEQAKSATAGDDSTLGASAN